MEDKKCVCSDCKFLRPCAKATERGIEYSFVCLANDMGLVDISVLYDMGISGCLDYQKEEEEVSHTNINLDFKDVQKIALQCKQLRDKENKEDEGE